MNKKLGFFWGLIGFVTIVLSPLPAQARAMYPGEAMTVMNRLEAKLKDPKTAVTKEDEQNLEDAYRTLGRRVLPKYNKIKDQMASRKLNPYIRPFREKPTITIDLEGGEVKPEATKKEGDEGIEGKGAPTDDKGKEEKIEQKDLAREAYEKVGKKIIEKITEKLKEFTNLKAFNAEEDDKFNKLLEKGTISIGSMFSSKTISIKNALKSYSYEEKTYATQTNDTAYIEQVNLLIEKLKDYFEKMDTNVDDCQLRADRAIENLTLLTDPITNRDFQDGYYNKRNGIQIAANKTIERLLGKVTTEKDKEEIEKQGKRVVEAITLFLRNEVNNWKTARWLNWVNTGNVKVGGWLFGSGETRKIKAWLEGFEHKKTLHKLSADQEYENLMRQLIAKTKDYFKVVEALNIKAQLNEALANLKKLISITSEQFQKTYEKNKQEIETLAAVQIKHLKEKAEEKQREEEKQKKRATIVPLVDFLTKNNGSSLNESIEDPYQFINRLFNGMKINGRLFKEFLSEYSEIDDEPYRKAVRQIVDNICNTYALQANYASQGTNLADWAQDKKALDNNFNFVIFYLDTLVKPAEKNEQFIRKYKQLMEGMKTNKNAIIDSLK